MSNKLGQKVQIWCGCVRFSGIEISTTDSNRKVLVDNGDPHTPGIVHTFDEVQDFIDELQAFVDEHTNATATETLCKKYTMSELLDAMKLLSTDVHDQ